MPDSPYTNREIREFMKDIKETTDRIEAQTTKTNGRVGRLEDWKSRGTGAMAVVILVVIPAISWLFYEVIALKSHN